MFFDSQKVRERFLDLFNEEIIESKYLAYFLGYLGDLEKLYKEALSNKRYSFFENKFFISV